MSNKRKEILKQYLVDLIENGLSEDVRSNIFPPYSFLSHTKNYKKLHCFYELHKVFIRICDKSSNTPFFKIPGWRDNLVIEIMKEMATAAMDLEKEFSEKLLAENASSNDSQSPSPQSQSQDSGKG